MKWTWSHVTCGKHLRRHCKHCGACPGTKHRVECKKSGKMRDNKEV